MVGLLGYIYFGPGLAFSRSLTSYAIITVLVWYFTEYGNDLVTSAIYFNIQGSLSSLLVIYMAHAADSFVGRFQALLFSNTAYIGGLMLVWMFNPYDVKWLIVVIIVLLSFGTSGSNVLQDVLKDLVNDIDKSQDRTKTRSLARAAIWSRIAYVSGAISSIMWVAPDAIGGVHSSWSSSFLICMITMTITLTIFCKGHNIYHQGELTERPVEAFFRVFLASIKKLPKCNIRYDLSEFCIPFLYTWICGLRKNNKVQIGFGMLCGIISCTCALVLEVYRLKEVNQLVDKNENTSISFLWLLPQFCVLGCMEGLTREGLLEFYMAQMKEQPLRSYGEEYTEIVMGFGKLLNIFLILIFQSQLGWFGNTINNSRLDNYYLVMISCPPQKIIKVVVITIKQIKNEVFQVGLTPPRANGVTHSVAEMAPDACDIHHQTAARACGRFLFRSPDLSMSSTKSITMHFKIGSPDFPRARRTIRITTSHVIS
ncbi:proton-dependent oligopeptide transporter family [Artemisia annua]|uniref:Proton-dependent oligopeptide transporter family n=1 Tax=Artemisia annua TaxID=35608 RepID=A0A2U1PQT9_ARTAN|nr:proton-dependent oligopeptide transporter family [Artemisia annua]